MRFKVDENLPQEVCSLLREHGHDAMSVGDQRMVGANDGRLAQVVLEEQRAVLTYDVGFGNIRRYPPGEYSGIIVLRHRQQDKASTLDAVGRLLPLFRTEPLSGTLWIVDESGVRIREQA